MARDHGPQIKDDAMYEALLKQGASEGKAARIANAHAGGTLKRNSEKLEERTVAELREEARRIGIAGWAGMRKAALVKAIRGHQ